MKCLNTKKKELIEYLSETEKKNDKNLVDIEKVKQLIKDGADVNFFGKKKHGYSGNSAAIHYAAKIGNLELMTLLIDNGADVNKKTKTSLTDGKPPIIPATNPIIIAAKFGHNNIVKFLLEKNVYITDSFGSDPLTYAASNGHLDIVKTLCSDKRISRDIKKKAFSSAAQTNKIEILEYLHDQIKPTQQENIKNFYQAASYHRDLNSLSFFINKNIINKDLIDSKDEEGKTALYRALSNNSYQIENAEIVDILFKAGAQLNKISNEDIESIVLGLVQTNAIKKLNLLVKNDKEKFIEDNVWLEGLCRSYQETTDDRIKLLFSVIEERGININLYGKDGQNVIQRAASNYFHSHNLDFIKYLIEKGANINSQDKDGNTPAHIISLYYGLNGTSRSESFKKEFETLGADFNIKNKRGETVDEVYKNAKKKGFYGYYPSAPTGTYIPSTPSNNNQNNKGNDQSESMNPLIVSSIDKTLIVGLSSYVKDALPAAISTSWNRLSTLTQPLTGVGLYITNSITKAIGASSSLRSSASNFIQTSFRAAAPIAVMVAAAQAVIKFVGSYSNGKTIIDSSINASYEAAASLGQSGAAAIGGALCAGVATSVGIAGAASIALPIVGAFTAAYAAAKASDYIKSSIVR